MSACKLHISMTKSILSSSHDIHSPSPDEDFNLRTLLLVDPSQLSSSTELVQLSHAVGSSDLAIRVGNKIFNCHRAMLIQESEYFDMMLSGHFKESWATVVTLQEYVSAEVFEEILNYIYSGHEGLEITDDNVLSLLHVSTYLLIPSIKHDCVTYVLRRRHLLKDEDVLEIFMYAFRLNITVITDRLRSFIAMRFSKFTSLDLFLEVHFDELISLLIAFKSQFPSFVLPGWSRGEATILDALVRWTSHAVSQRSKYIEEWTKMIDFQNISRKYLSLLAAELKFDPWRRWNDSFLFESAFKNFLRTSSDQIVVSNILPFFTDLEFSKRPPIHAYVRSSKSIRVFSINRLEPVWSPSLQTSVHGESNTNAPCNIGCCIHSDDWFHCFTLANDLNFVYCMKYAEHGRGHRQTFHVSSSLDIFSESVALTPPPERIQTSAVCGLASRIYFYECLGDGSITDAGLHLSCYNRERDEWLPVSQPVKPEYYASLIADQHLLYLIGGRSMRYSNDSVQVFDDRTRERWFELPIERHSHSYIATYCLLNGEIYGFDGLGMEVLDLRAMSWRSVYIDPMIGKDSSLMNNTSRIPMLAYNNQLWFFYHTLLYDQRFSVIDLESGKRFDSEFLSNAIYPDYQEPFSVVSVLQYPNTLKS